MFSETIHAIPLIIFSILAVVLVLFVLVSWGVIGVLSLTKKGSVTYKRTPFLLTGLYALSALAIIFTIYVVQQAVGGCVDATRHSKPEPCYDLNEWNWGWSGILLTAGVTLFSLIMLAIAFPPFKRRR